MSYKIKYYYFLNYLGECNYAGVNLIVKPIREKLIWFLQTFEVLKMTIYSKCIRLVNRLDISKQCSYILIFYDIPNTYLYINVK